MKKFLVILLILVSIFVLAFQFKPIENAVNTVKASIEIPNLVNKDSLTIASRVIVPKDYKRVEYAKGSFENYLRNYKLKPFGSKIINYDDTNYFWQGGHIGILEIPVQKTDFNNVQMH